MSARMQYVIFRREYSLVAAVSWIKHTRMDELVARLSRVAHQFAAHVRLFGGPEYFQNKKTSQFLHPSEPCNIKMLKHAMILFRNCKCEIKVGRNKKFGHVTYPLAAATSLH
jgi:hypothetical protein